MRCAASYDFDGGWAVFLDSEGRKTHGVRLCEG
jgi:hypothetical protein